MEVYSSLNFFFIALIVDLVLSLMLVSVTEDFISQGLYLLKISFSVYASVKISLFLLLVDFDNLIFLHFHLFLVIFSVISMMVSVIGDFILLPSTN